jgi:hypothetical protein
MGQRRGAYRVLVGKPEEKRPLRRPRRRREDNIEVDVQVNTRELNVCLTVHHELTVH